MEQGQLRVAADRGDGCAQLMAGIRGEPPQPFLAHVSAGERVLDMPEHPVEHAPDLAHLGAGIGVRDPRRHGDFATGERQLGHPGRCRGHPAQRTQRKPHPRCSRDSCGQQRRPEHDRLDQLQPLHGVLDGLERQACDQYVARGPLTPITR